MSGLQFATTDTTFQPAIQCIAADTTPTCSETSGNFNLFLTSSNRKTVVHSAVTCAPNYAITSLQFTKKSKTVRECHDAPLLRRVSRHIVVRRLRATRCLLQWGFTAKCCLINTGGRAQKMDFLETDNKGNVGCSDDQVMLEAGFYDSESSGAGYLWTSKCCQPDPMPPVQSRPPAVTWTVPYENSFMLSTRSGAGCLNAAPYAAGTAFDGTGTYGVGNNVFANLEVSK